MFSLWTLIILAAAIFGIAGFSMATSQASKLGLIQQQLRELEARQRTLMRDIDFMSAAFQASRSSKTETAPALETTPPGKPVVTQTAKTDIGATISGEPSIRPVRKPEADQPRTAAPTPAASEARIATREIGLEERLGTRWAVWVGGLALALGALLLVRYSIEQGFFGPGMRVTLGALLAAALIGAGEWLRRNEAQFKIDGIPDAHIPGVLTAAGTVAAFGTIYAAHALYGFLGAGSAFVLLGATGIATMMAARLHGPALAGLGLAASFATPALVSSSTPNPWPVVLYLGAVAAAAYALSAARRWPWLALSAAAGGVLWGTEFAVHASEQHDWIVPAMALAVIQLGLAAYFLAFKPADGTNLEHDQSGTPSIAVFAALSLLAVFVLIANNGVSPASVAFAVVMTGILAAVGGRLPALAPVMAMAGSVVLAKLMIWPSESGSRFDPYDFHGFWSLFTPPLHQFSFLTFAEVAAVAVAGASGFRLYSSPQLKSWSSGWYAATATVLPFLALVIAYLRMTGFESSTLFTAGSVGLAVLFALAAASFEDKEKTEATTAIKLGTGALAAATVAALALALVIYLDRGYLTVALAIAALGTAVMADLKKIPALRLAVSALGVVVLGRVLWDPRIMGDGVGTTPIFNWLLFGYGIPAAAFFFAARTLRKTDDDLASRICEALAVIFAGLLAFFEIRHFLNGGDVFALRTDHVELGLMVLTSLGFAYALMKSGILSKSPVLETAAQVFGGLSLAGSILGLLIIHNPYFSSEVVRSAGPIDTLMLAYMLPAFAAAFLARHAQKIWPAVLVVAVAALAMALIFTFVSLEVRHAFHGPVMTFADRASQAELWSYSAAWLMLGIALLGYGLWRGMQEARLASALLVTLVVLKVFLWDMAGLEGAWRAFSFIGLGAVLVGIGLVYQRYVFGTGKESPV